MDTLLADPFREALRAACELPLEELFARRSAELWPAFERGELDEATYWARWADDGIVVDPDAFHRARRAGTRWLPGMRELLGELDGRALRVAASNYPVWIEEVTAEHLDGLVDRVVASHHLGVRKPDPVFFVRLLDTLEVAAPQAVFVDDRQVNVDAAEELGIESHRFVDAPTLRAWLVDTGVL
ncbi:HAD-IA family hydrolase [Nitriliruptoraceae bacterium ZYF776]|nr:HAD-IA family hydrolase [Profundirhabdus halotolerans]